MSIKLPKPILFLLAYLVTVFLYWPAMHGSPVWDDFNFWFTDPNMKLPYSIYWQNFAWPLSVSLQKFLLNILEKNYFGYHLINLLLHFANSFLVYKLGRNLRFKYPFIFFLLFLLHPVAVISTAWMIQFKTLLCFFFALASLLAFLKGHKNIKWMAFSWFLFACSMTSKTPSLFLPVIFLVISVRQYRFSKLHLLIPFFLISLWGGWKVIKSRVTIEGVEKASQVTKIKSEPPPEIPLKEIIPAAKVTEVKTEKKIKAKVPKAKKKKIKKEKKKETLKATETPVTTAPEKKNEVTPEPIPDPINMPRPMVSSSLQFLGLDINLVGQTLHYYFWQSFLPQHNEPVKGLNFEKAGLVELIHFFFLIILVILFWKDAGLFYLLAAHFLLLPFLGLIPAPFMNVTWVSDQHLYLVLPALLAFWMRMLERIKWKFSVSIPVVVILFFVYETRKATPIYENQFTFYERCLKYNPYNVPIAYNLAMARILNDEVPEAYNVLSNTVDLANQEPILKKNLFYPYLTQLYIQVRLVLEKNEN